MKNKVVSMLFIILAGCGLSATKQLDLTEYLKWYNSKDCDLRNTKNIGDYTFISEYRPVDYMVASEMQKNDSYDQSTYDSLKVDFEGMHYFLLKIKTSDPSKDILNYNLKETNEYFSRLQYFSELAQEDIYLISENDTVQCALYHFERTYNSSPYNNILIGFERNKSNTDSQLKLCFNENALGNGMLYFNYSKDAITNSPKLKL
ncbi:MAG: hypothetical protein MUE96_08110 [Bacteroidia bacterium]|nr:hypothetical protein [Bacteroidia bacterium]